MVSHERALRISKATNTLVESWINMQQAVDELRIGFVIVDPLQRGKGKGKEMLKLALKYAFDVYGARRIDLDKSGFMLGFTPLEEDRDKCISEVYDGGDDYRLFYRGKKLESIEKDKLYFPDLSHA